MSFQQPTPGNWQPPANFQPVASTVEGITVYAPRPETVKTDAPVSYKCPNCGASTRFNIAAGGVACEHCGYTAQAKADKVGRGAQTFEFTLETLNQAEQGWGIDRRELHCDSCGAVLSLAEGALTVTCPFCASNQVNVRPAPSDVLRPRFLIPFKVQPEAVRARAREWLGKGWYHPQELGASAIIDRFTGVYLPYWTFDSHITADWKAEVGYERQERYYDHSDKEWKTRTEIDWRWEDGRVTLQIDDLLIAGTTRASRIILDRLSPFQLNELVAYAPDYLAGWQAQAYDITLPDAWEMGKTAMREQAKKACHEDIHSSHVRNFSMTADFADEAWRYLLLPVYIASYKFEDKVYQVMANGQTGLVAGQKPVAWWKIWLAIAAMLTPGLGLGLIGLPLTLVGGVGLILIVLGLILLVIGGVFSFGLYKQAVASEAA
ncbi:MAG: hypothetical protein EHM70_17165 [Chloroflexota bacterium]|nr:MAG: hypothetical protein EHM70_17165 [Chloroflexota bacterium]